ncbi:hypothetical protein SAMN04487914_15311 [Arthrobacter sp. ok909]|nr:hypothetical protein SAMN04487914_15311 [Arthrobacter sp. ok909]
MCNRLPIGQVTGMDKQFHGQAEARAGDLCKEPGITRQPALPRPRRPPLHPYRGEGTTPPSPS